MYLAVRIFGWKYYHSHTIQHN
ncbi:phage tail protein, partial [Salmonella enterica]|nr:phage tail protein [Salmonella enterica]